METDKLRQFIKKLLKEEIELSGNKEKAKQALIALSRNLIPDSDIEFNFEINSSDYEDGYNETDGIIITKILYEGISYELTFEVFASFYLSGGYEGDFLSPIDSARAPEPDEIEDEEISVDNKEILMYDQDQNEYEFSINEFDPDFLKRIEKILVKYYNP